MTVGELIDRLKNYDPDDDVIIEVEGSETSLDAVKQIAGDVYLS